MIRIFIETNLHDFQRMYHKPYLILCRKYKEIKHFVKFYAYRNQITHRFKKKNCASLLLYKMDLY